MTTSNSRPRRWSTNQNRALDTFLNWIKTYIQHSKTSTSRPRYHCASFICIRVHVTLVSRCLCSRLPLHSRRKCIDLGYFSIRGMNGWKAARRCTICPPHSIAAQCSLVCLCQRQHSSRCPPRGSCWSSPSPQQCWCPTRTRPT